MPKKPPKDRTADELKELFGALPQQEDISPERAERALKRFQEALREEGATEKPEKKASHRDHASKTKKGRVRD